MASREDKLYQAIMGIIVAIFLLWLFIIRPIIIWIKEHWVGIMVTIGIILVIMIIFIILYYKYIREDKAPDTSPAKDSKELLEEVQAGEVSTSFHEKTPKKGIHKKSQPKLTKLDKIVKALKNYPADEYRDEKEFEKAVFAYLKAKFPNYNVSPQFHTKKGKVDLVIDDKYAIELKLADNRSNVRNLLGQLRDYRKVFKHLAVVVLDVGKVKDLRDYAKDWKKEGCKVVILSGALKRKKHPFMKQTIYRK